MLINNVIIDSFQEYSGLQSTVFFSKQCNLNCPWCHNLKEITNDENIGLYKNIFHNYINDMTQAIVFLGGEPTIWNNLSDNMKLTKIHYPELKIKLFTNGQYPEIIKKTIPYLDAISFDYKMYYYNKLIIGKDKPNYHNKLNESINLVYNELNDIEIRTTKNNYLYNDEIQNIELKIQRNWPKVRFIEQKLMK
jgi:pyruvate-formate lyase-activating enzyme